MAEIKREVGINVSMKASLDKTSTAKLMKAVQTLRKESEVTIGEIKGVSKATDVFSKRLNKAAKQNFQQIKQLGDELEEAYESASNFGNAIDKAKSPKAKAKLETELAKQQAKISNLNKSITDWQKNNVGSVKQLKGMMSSQEKYNKTLSKAAQYSPDRLFGDLKSGIDSVFTKGRGAAGLGGLLKAVSSRAAGVIGERGSKHAEIASKSGDPVEAAAAAESARALAKAATAITGATAGIAMFVSLIMKAADHMSILNKALVKGIPLAGDFGKTGAQYRQIISDMSQAAQNAHGSLLKFGLSSEKALEITAAFGHEAATGLGSLQTMITQMGGGDLTKGMEDLTKNAHLYGKALGMEATDVASMMGNMMTEIGYSHQKITGVMDQIVKTAATSNIPAHKFMDIFKEAIPNIDLYLNRIEELTGAIKILSKTMSPKDMKAFMQTLGKGFDQLDFKNRLKMALLIGPQKVAGILTKDFERSGQAIADNLPENLRKAMMDALNDKDPMKAMAAVAARAAASGVDSAAIGDMQKLARSKASLNKGNVLDTASAMKGAGAYARLDMLEQLSMSLTKTKDISGISEAVSEKVGISADQLKAIQGLQNSLMTWKDQIAKAGRTSSKAINQGLIKVLKIERKFRNKDGQEQEKTEKELNDELASKLGELSPDQLDEAIKQAGAEQLDGDKTAAESAEDMAAEQYNATASIGDKIESIVGYYLEKIFSILQPILDTIENLFKYMTADEGAKNAIKAEEAMVIQQTRAAADSKKLQEGILKSRGATKQQSDSYAGMGQIIDEASNSKTEDVVKNLEPIIEQSGNLTTDEFKKQKDKFGSVLRGSPDMDRLYENWLDMAQKAHDTGDKKAEAAARQGAQQVVRDSLENNVNTGFATNAINSIGSIAGGLSMQGVSVSSLGSGAGDSDRKKTKAEQDQIDLAKHNSDLDTGVSAILEGGADKSSSSSVLVTGQPASAQTAAAQKSAEVTEKSGAGPAGVATSNAIATSDPKIQKKEVKLLDTSVELLEKNVDQSDLDYQASADTLGLLKKGIKFEDGFLKNKFKRTLKEATLESFRQALTEFAIIEAKMQTDKDFASALADNGTDILKSGMLLGSMTKVSGNQSSAQFKWMTEHPDVPKLASGGSIAQGGLAVLHSGETVVPKGSGGNYTIVMNFNETGMTSDEVKRATLQTLDEVKRRP